MYLKRSSTPDTIHSSETPVEDAPYATVVSIGVPSGHGDGIPSRQSFSNPKECAEAIKRRTSSESQVIFLRGYPSPEWIKYIGGCCRISDLEFFRWNLRFQCRRDWCLSPPLSSASSKIIKLRFVTIGSRESSGKKQATVDELREKADRGMQSYDHDLRIGSSIKKGDSIVRDYFVLDERHVVIEQEMVICINKVGNNWTSK
jgi:hypothetical protein